MRENDLETAVRELENEADALSDAVVASNGQADAVTVAEALLLVSRTTARLAKLRLKIKPKKGGK